MISKNHRKESLYRRPRKPLTFQRVESKPVATGVFGKTSLASLVSEKKSRSLPVSQKRSGLSAGSRAAGKTPSRHTGPQLAHQCASDSTVALAGPAGGAGIGNWEGNRLRLSFMHGLHEGPSARAKCTAFWAQLDEQAPYIRNMCASGYPKGKEQRQAAVDEAEAAFRAFLGKDKDGHEQPQPGGCSWAGGGTIAKGGAAPDGAKDSSAKVAKAPLESVCRGRVALEGVAKEVERMGDLGELGEPERREMGPWQRRLRALQALGLDKLAAAAEWRESPIRAPTGWPRSAMTSATEGGAVGVESPTVPAALPPSQVEMEQLAEDVRRLPPPQMPLLPEAIAPPPGVPQIYRQMPQLRLPPPEEPGPPPAPVFPCPTQWCGPHPCHECLPCDPRYADIGQYSVFGLPDNPEPPTKGRTGQPSVAQPKRRKSKPSKVLAPEPCQPDCTCCECRASAPPPTPNLPNRSSTGGASSGEVDGPTRLPDSGGGGDMGERQGKSLSLQGRDTVIGAPDEGRQSTKSTRRSLQKVGSNREATDEDASCMSSSRQAGSMGEVVGVDRDDEDELKHEDPFRSVLLDVLKPGHVRPPLPPPAKPQFILEPVEVEHEQPMFKEVMEGLYATTGSPGKVTSYPSLCRTSLPPEGPPSPPRPPGPSEFVGPGESLSGYGLPALPLLYPRPQPPHVRTRYKGVKDPKVPTTTVLPPLRTVARPSLQSPPQGSAPTDTTRHPSTSTAAPEAKLMPKDESKLPGRLPYQTVMNVVDRLEGESSHAFALPPPILLNQQYVEPGTTRASRWRPWMAPPVAKEPPVHAQSVLSWTAVSRGGQRRGGGARPLFGAEVALAPGVVGPGERAAAPVSGRGGGKSQRLANENILSSSFCAIGPGGMAGNLTRGLPVGAALTSLALPAATGGGRLVLLSEPAEAQRPPPHRTSGHAVPLPQSHRQATLARARQQDAKDILALQQQLQQPQQTGDVIAAHRKQMPGSRSRISFSQQTEQQLRVHEPLSSGSSLSPLSPPQPPASAVAPLSAAPAPPPSPATMSPLSTTTTAMGAAQASPQLMEAVSAGGPLATTLGHAWAGPYGSRPPPIPVSFPHPSLASTVPSPPPPSPLLEQATTALGGSPTPSRRPRPSAPKPGRRRGPNNSTERPTNNVTDLHVEEVNRRTNKLWHQ